jgi:hypothetical protein
LTVTKWCLQLLTTYTKQDTFLNKIFSFLRGNFLLK